MMNYVFVREISHPGLVPVGIPAIVKSDPVQGGGLGLLPGLVQVLIFVNS